VKGWTWKSFLWLAFIAWVLVPILICATLTPLCWCAWKYSSRVSADIADGTDSGKGLIKELQRGQKRDAQIAEDTGKAVKQFTAILTAIQTGTLPKMDGLLATANGTLAATTTTIAKTGDAADTLKGKVQELDVTADQKHAIALIDEFATLPPAVTAALEPLAPLEISLTRTSTAAGDFLDAPRMATLITNLGVLSASGAGFLNEGTVLETNIHGYIKPWDHKKPVKHYAGVAGKTALGLAGAGASVGIAIAK